ncbi:hypothetical protein C5S36_04250 [Candidatus Methanophagaceae archaeon]|nr:hypothetical protein C5S36_04250 [Methanophagales archaeon]
MLLYGILPLVLLILGIIAVIVLVRKHGGEKNEKGK